MKTKILSAPFVLIALLITLNVNAQTWVETAKSLPASVGDYQHYGISVSVDGDYAVIGSEYDEDFYGCAYVLFFDGSNWITQAKLTASDPAGGFGLSVSISGDHIVIGAPFDDVNGDQSGSAFVFTKPPAGWADATETAKLLPSDGAPGEEFGGSVSISGNTIVIGAHLDDDNGPSSGSAYVFTQPPAGWTNSVQTAKLLASDGEDNDEFGFSVSISGENIVVGAINDNEGSVYIFENGGSEWIDMTETARITASDGEPSDWFGYSVSISGDNIVVGAPDSFNGKGSAYVFIKPATGWTGASETAKLLSSDPPFPDFFGISVSHSQDHIVVGSLPGAGNGNRNGAAYVFAKPSTGWTDATETVKLMASDGAHDDFFGWSASISGNHIVIGAAGDFEYGYEAGSAYLFINCQTSSTISPEACDYYVSPSGNYTWTTSGTYYDTIPNTSGCDSLITIHLNVITMDASVTINGTTLTANTTGAEYQWLDCNNNMAVIPDETSQSFTAFSNGSYAVQVTQNGCTATSDCQTVTNTDIIAFITSPRPFIYPNPTAGELIIDLGSFTGKADVFVKNLNGQTLQKHSVLQTEKIKLNLPSSPGTYLIEIHTPHSVTVLKAIRTER